MVAKSQLLEHVWDTYDSLDLNVVEVYAGYLRRKIDAPFGAQRPADRARGGLPAGRGRRLSPGRPGRRGAGLGGRPRAGASTFWRRRSLRARVTLASTAGLALALAAAALLLSSVLRVSLTRDAGQLGPAGRGGGGGAGRRAPAARPGSGRGRDRHRAGARRPGPDRERVAGRRPAGPAAAPAQAAGQRAGRDRVAWTGRPTACPVWSGWRRRRPGTAARCIAAVAYGQVRDSLALLAHALVIGTPVLLLLLAGAMLADRRAPPCGPSRN